MTTLYKKDSKGKIRYLKTLTKGAELIQESGILNTDKPVVHKKMCTAKNVGKSNEISPSDQATLEEMSIIAKKLDAGYFTSMEDAENEEVIMPMLADTYEKVESKIDWSNAYIQPKLDGMRCLAFIEDGNVTLKSRDGKIIQNMDHIINELSKIKENVILDGELYKHGDSFQENMKLIKKYRAGRTEQIKYHVYDMVSNDDFTTRFNKAVSLIGEKHVVSVYTQPISDESIKSELHSCNLKDGYEGSIIRWGNSGYEKSKRSKHLLKLKDFSDMDLSIVDIEPAEVMTNHGVPVFEIDGNRFRSGVKMSHEDREDLLKNKDKYIGKIANLRFFEMTDGGIPRFPVMIGIHEDR